MNIRYYIIEFEVCTCTNMAVYYWNRQITFKCFNGQKVLLTLQKFHHIIITFRKRFDLNKYGRHFFKCRDYPSHKKGIEVVRENLRCYRAFLVRALFGCTWHVASIRLLLSFLRTVLCCCLVRWFVFKHAGIWRLSCHNIYTLQKSKNKLILSLF